MADQKRKRIGLGDLAQAVEDGELDLSGEPEKIRRTSPRRSEQDEPRRGRGRTREKSDATPLTTPQPEVDAVTPEVQVQAPPEPAPAPRTKSALKQRLQELRAGLQERGLSAAATREKLTLLKEAAPEYATLYPEAVRVLRELNRELGGKDGRERWRQFAETRDEGEAAEEILRECGENPYAADLVAQGRREAWEKRLTDLKGKATGTLHQACTGKSVRVAMSVRYSDKFTVKDRTTWILFSANPEDRSGVAKIEETTTPLPFLKGWFNLRGAPEFADVVSPELRNALASLYKYENAREAERTRVTAILEKRTISLTEAMAGEKGQFAVHHREWRTPKGWGPLTYNGEATGEALILLEFFAPAGQIDLSDLIGVEQPLGELNPLFAKVVNARLQYERKMAERDQSQGDRDESPQKPEA